MFCSFYGFYPDLTSDVSLFACDVGIVGIMAEPQTQIYKASKQENEVKPSIAEILRRGKIKTGGIIADIDDN